MFMDFVYITNTLERAFSKLVNPNQLHPVNTNQWRLHVLNLTKHVRGSKINFYIAIAT